MSDNEHLINFSDAVLENGEIKLVNTRMIRQSDIGRCPHFIMVASHYREDGTCKCDDPVEQAMMIKEWGYKRADFTKKDR